MAAELLIPVGSTAATSSNFDLAAGESVILGVRGQLTLRRTWEDDMTNLKTDDALLRALADAAQKQPTADEIEAQRVSFIMGSVSEKSAVSRHRVTEILASHDGKKVA